MFEDIKDLKNFCKNNRAMVWIILLFTLLTYGFAIVHFSISIDTEDLILKQMGFYNGWYGVDRYGLVLSKWLFGHLILIPGATWFGVAVLMVVSGILWEYLLYRIGGNSEKKYYGLLPIALFTSVNMLELLNFQCLSFEIMLAMIFLVLSILLIYEWALGEGRKKTLLLGLTFMVWAFGSYQAFVPLYIASVLGCFLLVYDRKKAEEKPWIGKMVFQIIGSFLAGYGLYTFVGKAIRKVTNIGEGVYTDSMLRWGKDPVDMILASIRGYIGSVVTGEGVTWNYGYSIISIALICFLIYKFVRREKKQKGLVIFSLALFGFLISPFLLCIALGAAPVDRAQLAVPFVLGMGSEILTGEIGQQKRMAGWFVNILILFLIYRNVVTTDNQLLYTAYMVYEQEKQFSEELVSAVEKCGGREGKTRIAVIGTWRPNYNPSMIVGETLGKSFYEWDAGVPNGTNRRIAGLWKVLGYSFDEVPTEEYAVLQEKAAGMPVWPEEGSVVVEDEVAIIKISQ